MKTFVSVHLVEKTTGVFYKNFARKLSSQGPQRSLLILYWAPNATADIFSQAIFSLLHRSITISFENCESVQKNWRIWSNDGLKSQRISTTSNSPMTQRKIFSKEISFDRNSIKVDHTNFKANARCVCW